MIFNDKRVDDIKIAYIGGGSRGWAWNLMRDLSLSKDISGTVALYDIDKQAAKNNALIGNKIMETYPESAKWNYISCDTIDSALKDANFVIISILPGTFDEMESDVHTPEKYGIYQSVGDTSGPGGIIRALRTIPMYEFIAKNIKEHCPKAWVINYTNPMTMCTKTLYKVFPQIKAFGCCHEVFGTQRLLASALDEICSIKNVDRKQIKVNVIGINHFTWLTSAKYNDIDLFPVYKKFIDNHKRTDGSDKDAGRKKFFFDSHDWVKYDLFERFSAIAAAGDRHLAEFCPGSWYLNSPDWASSWGFSLTPVSWRKGDLNWRIDKCKKIISGEDKFEMYHSGEEGADQIRAILGLCDLVTNVNLPNYGQIPNLPLGAVVETNAAFTSDTVTPVFAGNIPNNLLGLIAPVVSIQESVVDAALNRDLNAAFVAFTKDPLVSKISPEQAKKLFDEMIDNTKQYLSVYFN